MKAVYGTQISENMTKTPEGFLVCHNVPIARTGEYEYLASEIGLDGRDVVKVYRGEDEVFSPAAMASFEGMVTTNDHPQEEVNSQNATRYARGHARNIRRDGDNVVADLIIFDAELIDMIESGKRQISCGYSCEYEQDEDGKIHQRKIRGNHIAVVKTGRAGDRVAIQDKKPERSENMKKTHPFWAMFKKAAVDASPEELSEMAAMAPKDEESPAEEQKEATSMEAILQRLGAVEATLAALVKSDKEVHAEADEMEMLEKDLEKEAEVDPEKLEVIDADEEEKEEEEKPAVSMDSDSRLAMVRKMKPIIAGMKDSDEKKKMIAALRDSVMPVRTDVKNGYKIAVTAKAKDSVASVPDQSQIGKDIMKANNPHYKNK